MDKQRQIKLLQDLIKIETIDDHEKRLFVKSC